jgi:hypothetical protein
MAAGKREFLERVVEDLNLDIRDPFTLLLANAMALADQRDALKAELSTHQSALEEAEGRCCPEDVGFEEWIGVLKKRDNVVAHTHLREMVSLLLQTTVPIGPMRDRTDYPVELQRAIDFLHGRVAQSADVLIKESSLHSKASAWDKIQAKLTELTGSEEWLRGEGNGTQCAISVIERFARSATAPRRCREGADRDCSPACDEKSRTYCSWKKRAAEVLREYASLIEESEVNHSGPLKGRCDPKIEAEITEYRALADALEAAWVVLLRVTPTSRWCAYGPATHREGDRGSGRRASAPAWCARSPS